MRRIFVFLILFLFCFSWQTCAKQLSIQDIMDNLPEIKNTYCDFTQEKYISNSGIKLVSGGKFQFDKENGVIFETLYPIQNTISYSASANQKINRIVNAISNQNFSALEKNFDLVFDEKETSWYLQLTPKTDSQMAQVLKFIELSGNKQSIEKIHIYNVNSDYTLLKFSCPKE